MATKGAAKGLKGLGELLKSDQRRLVEGEGVEGVFNRMAPAPVAGTILKVPIEEIHPDPSQPRRTLDPESLEELASSIRQLGVREPIHVVEAAGGYRILTGERRWLAARRAGLKAVPVIVERPMEEGEKFLLQLVENIQREDLNAVDRAEALKVLRQKLHLRSWAAVGERLGIGRRRVYQLLATTELPAEIQADIRSGRISEKDSRSYQGLTAEQQLALHRLQREKRWRSAQLREAAALLREDPDLTPAEAASRIERRRRPRQPPSPSPEEAPPEMGPVGRMVQQAGALSAALAGALERDLWWQCSYGEQARLHESLFQLRRDVDRFLLSTQRLKPPSRAGGPREQPQVEQAAEPEQVLEPSQERA